MPTSYTFAPGHRLQFTLTGSDWRERARDANAQPKSITLISDKAHPSSVSMPLIAR